MRKLEASEAFSNLLVVTSVSLAFTPFLLGDRLFIVAMGLINESSVLLDQLSTFLTRLVS